MAITTVDLHAFISSAPGTRFDPDGMYGIQCVDLIDAYAVYLWGNWQSTIGAGNANQLWNTASSAHFDRILNVAGDLTNFPRYGDVVIWNGDGLNPYGHIAICVSATPYTMNVLQQNADGRATAPAAVGTLGYDQPGTGPVIGWLRPKVYDGTISVEGEIKVALKPNERMTGASDVRMHDDTTVGSASPRTIPAGSKEVFGAWRKGETVTAGGQSSNIWYGDTASGPWVSALFFDPLSTAGLTDVNPAPAPTTPNARKVGPNGALMRSTAEVRSDNVIREIPGGTTELFTRYRHAQEVTGSNGFKSDLWYGDSDGFSWAGGYEDQSTAGLKDDTIPAAPVKPPVVVPPVAPPPVVVVPPVVLPPVTVSAGLDGVDVSGFQQAFDFKAAGVQFAIIKASEGGLMGNPDKMLALHVDNARKAGIRVEFYHYAHIGQTAENTPELEAAVFLEAVRPHFREGDVVNLDWEHKAIDLSRGDLALKWLDIVRAELKCKARFYTYQNVLIDHAAALAVIRNAGYHLWLASYPAAMAGLGFNTKSPKPLAPGWTLDVWQYSSTGKLPGYAGDLDLNRMYTTVDPVPARTVAEIAADIRANIARINALIAELPG